MQALIVLALATMAYAAPKPCSLCHTAAGRVVNVLEHAAVSGINPLIASPVLADVPAVSFATPARTLLADVPAINYAPSYYARNFAYDYIPTITPDGYVADTPEVALAKAAHITEHALTAARNNRYPYYF